MTTDERIARAEHELRGAAAALALACEALRRNPDTPNPAEVIGVQLDRLRAGLADLASARDCEAPAAAPERVEFSALVRAASEPWCPASFEWKGGSAPATLDRRRLAKVLGNVLANAAEHGSGDIRVTGRARNGGVQLQVRNRGRGLVIAAQAAEELGGRLSFEVEGNTAIATLDLPLATAADEAPAA